MPSYTASDAIQLPRLTAFGAMALGEQIFSAAKPFKKGIGKGIAKVLATLGERHVTLADTLRDQVVPAQMHDAETVRIDKCLDGCWSGLSDFCLALSKLPDVPEAVEAAEIRAVVFNEGLKFTQLQYVLEWSESQTRLGRIAKLGLDKRIAALGGQIFLDALGKWHAAYGEALGITAAKSASAAPLSVREALDGFCEALRIYVVKVMGSVESDEPNTQELADTLLAPLAAWAVGPMARGGGTKKLSQKPSRTVRRNHSSAQHS